MQKLVADEICFFFLFFVLNPDNFFLAILYQHENHFSSTVAVQDPDPHVSFSRIRQNVKKGSGSIKHRRFRLQNTLRGGGVLY